MGSRGSGTKRAGGGGGLNPGDIISEKDMISERRIAPEAANDFLGVSRDMWDTYGENIGGAFVFAELKPKAAKSVLAYYDGANIGLNTAFADAKKMTDAYDKCVSSGYHPGRGNKSAMQAVAAHEFGHALTDAVASKMGIKGINALHEAANRVVEEARKESGHRGVVQMAAKISKYATASNAEAIAEAVADVYCNGTKAKAESHAIVNVVNKYLK